MDRRKMNEEYQEIAKELIDTCPELEAVRESDLTIICLSSEAKKKKGDKMVLGQCEKVADKYKWGIPCDFTITVFEPNIVGFTDEQLHALLFHELLHIGIEDDRYFVKPHDLEDFKVIIDKYGTNWAEVPEVL